jgi:hypothetical protein
MKTSPVSVLELTRNAFTILIVAYAAGSSAQNTPLLSTSRSSYFDSSAYGTGTGTGNNSGPFPPLQGPSTESIYAPRTTGESNMQIQSGTTVAPPDDAPTSNSSLNSDPLGSEDNPNMPNGKMRDVDATGSSSHNLGY